MTRHPRAAHAIGVTDRDRATVDIELFIRDPKRIAAIQHLHRESLVQLPKIDVVYGQTVTFQQPRHREDWADTHLVRVTAGDRQPLVQTQRLNIPLLGELGIHNYTGRRAIRQLASIAGGDKITCPAHRQEPGKGFDSGARTIAFIPV